MEQQLKKPTYLSASKIKTLDSCSWQYYASYELGIPQKGNSGASRGTVVHNLFELISKAKHQHYIKKIWNAGSPEKIPAIKRFLENQFLKEKISKEEPVKPIKAKLPTKDNWETVCDMVMTTMKFEFIDKDFSKIIDSEYEFNIVNESPRYAIRGFIDRVEIDGDDIKILDYKSSSKKFKGDDEDANIQAMMYSLVARKIWKNYKNYKASFFFMRFPDSPYQDSNFSENEIDGLEHYLEYITSVIEKIDEKSATNNMAYFDRKKSWLCQMGKWTCPYKNPMTFYKIIEKDESKRTAKGVSSHIEYQEALEKIEKNKKEQEWEIEVIDYSGCPAFK